MFRRSRELESALALLAEMGPKVEALENENLALRAKAESGYTVSVVGDDPLTTQSFTFAQQARQIADLQAEVKAFRLEVETQNGVVQKANDKARVADESLARALASQQPIIEERDRLREEVAKMVPEEDLSIAHTELDNVREELRNTRERHYAKLTELDMAHKDEVERLSHDLTKALHERDIFAKKLQEGLASLTAAITEVAGEMEGSERDVRASASE
jgi:hypothetical protein